jgi:hypothetical protein
LLTFLQTEAEEPLSAQEKHNAFKAQVRVAPEKSIRQAAESEKAEEQTEKSEILDPTSAGVNATTPEDTAEMIDEPLRNSTNDAALDGGDDKDVNKTKSSPVTEAARARMGRDADARAEGREAKQKGKGREKARKARRSPERRS